MIRYFRNNIGGKIKYLKLKGDIKDVFEKKYKIYRVNFFFQKVEGDLGGPLVEHGSAPGRV